MRDFSTNYREREWLDYVDLPEAIPVAQIIDVRWCNQLTRPAAGIYVTKATFDPLWREPIDETLVSPYTVQRFQGKCYPWGLHAVAACIDDLLQLDSMPALFRPIEGGQSDQMHEAYDIVARDIRLLCRGICREVDKFIGRDIHSEYELMYSPYSHGSHFTGDGSVRLYRGPDRRIKTLEQELASCRSKISRLQDRLCISTPE